MGRADANALYTVWGGANDLFSITAPAQAPAVIGVSAAISGATPAHRITFRPDGLARPGNDRNILAATLQVCVATTRPPDNARLVRLSGARVSVDAPAANAACAAPANQ